MRKTFYYALTWICALVWVTLAWVGAEWLFEGAVHSSEVDGAVAAILACCIAERRVKK